MENRKTNDNRKMHSIVSIIVLIAFIVAELFYFKIIEFLTKDMAIEIETTYIETTEVESETAKKVRTYKIGTVSETYFENTLFIGDSRFVGFSIYRKIPGATYYCYQSADTFTILDKEYDVEPYGKITLYDLLSGHSFDKIYISLGINNVGAGIENHRSHYKEFLDTVINLQPDAIVYLIANLHVTSELKDNSAYVNNDRINAINEFIQEFEDRKRVFYFDPNVLYDDEFGNMDSTLSYDNAHVYVRHYDRLLYFLVTHAIIYD